MITLRTTGMSEGKRIRSTVYNQALKDLGDRYLAELGAAIAAEAATSGPAGTMYYARAVVRDAHYDEFTGIYARHLAAAGLSPPGGQHKPAEPESPPAPEGELGGFASPQDWALVRELKAELAKSRTTVARLGAKLGRAEDEARRASRGAGELRKANQALQGSVDAALVREQAARQAGYRALAATAFAAAYQLGEDWLSRELTVPAELVTYAERGELTVRLRPARDGSWVLTAELFARQP